MENNKNEGSLPQALSLANTIPEIQKNGILIVILYLYLNIINIARYTFIKRNGISYTEKQIREGVLERAIPLSQMPTIINNRGLVLEKEFKAKNPNATITQMRNTVSRQIAEEFGLVE